MNGELMRGLQGKVVKINRGGHEARTGLVLGSTDDYFTLLTEKDGVVYYKHDHVKSMTDNAKKGLDFNMELPETLAYLKADTFGELLSQMKYQWVKINRGGHDALEGVLDDVNENYVTIVHHEEVVRIALFHIKSVSYGVKVENKEDQKEEKKEENKEDNKQSK
ncbi:hypothetical protein [Falsibacillus pallidus]|uniref:hypothetical protein n=1 Tax=Falsibacillus pallidus TaxID=493781 RepID=UPI003D9653FD